MSVTLRSPLYFQDVGDVRNTNNRANGVVLTTCSSTQPSHILLPFDNNHLTTWSSWYLLLLTSLVTFSSLRFSPLHNLRLHLLHINHLSSRHYAPLDPLYQVQLSVLSFLHTNLQRAFFQINGFLSEFLNLSFAVFACFITNKPFCQWLYFS